jgi:hypothetical protein
MPTPCLVMIATGTLSLRFAPIQASHVMGILVAEMRQVGIDRWLMQHRAFMVERVVVLDADQVVITPYPRSGSSVRDSVDDNFGAW